MKFKHYFIITTDDEALEKVKVKYIDEEKEKTVVDDPCEVLVLKKDLPPPGPPSCHARRCVRSRGWVL